MYPLEHHRMNDLLSEAFLDIADRIGRTLTAEFNDRYEAPTFFFNAGYSYTDFIGRIMSTLHGRFSDEDRDLGLKIISREVKKLGSAEVFTLRLYAMEYGDSSFRSSLVDSKYHILHNWAMTLMAGYNGNPYLQDNCLDPLGVLFEPSTCPHCGGKVVDVVCGELTEERMHQADNAEIVFRGGHKFPDDEDWECLNCGGQFKLLEKGQTSAQ